MASIWRDFLATRVASVCFWKLKFYRSRNEIHTYIYMYENIHAPAQLIFDTPVFEGWHCSFESEIRATSSIEVLRHVVPLRSVLGNSTQN